MGPETASERMTVASCFLRVTPLFLDDLQSFTHVLSLQLCAPKAATETPSWRFPNHMVCSAKIPAITECQLLLFLPEKCSLFVFSVSRSQVFLSSFNLTTHFRPCLPPSFFPLNPWQQRRKQFKVVTQNWRKKRWQKGGWEGQIRSNWRLFSRMTKVARYESIIQERGEKWGTEKRKQMSWNICGH